MNHVPIRISTLRGDQKIDFDVFIKINDKFILYLRKGDSFEGTRLTRLREKKLKKMFILPETEDSYRKYLIYNMDMAYNSSSKKPLELRTQVAQGFQQSIAEELLENPADAKFYEEAKSVSSRFAEFLIKEPESLKFLLEIENLDQNIAHHGVTVASYAVRLAHQVGIKSEKDLQLLTVGCLLHDLEHGHTPVPLSKTLKEMTEEELKTYKKHPTAGAHRLGDKNFFDRIVIDIIAQHEEFIDGNGFPQGLRESGINPLAVIVGSANKLDRKISFEKIPRKDAGRQLMLNCLGQYPLDHLKILSELVK